MMCREPPLRGIGKLRAAVGESPFVAYEAVTRFSAAGRRTLSPTLAALMSCRRYSPGEHLETH
jgi:hypothetical protein